MMMMIKIIIIKIIKIAAFDGVFFYPELKTKETDETLTYLKYWIPSRFTDF